MPHAEHPRIATLTAEGLLVNGRPDWKTIVKPRRVPGMSTGQQLNAFLDEMNALHGQKLWPYDRYQTVNMPDKVWSRDGRPCLHQCCQS